MFTLTQIAQVVGSIICAVGFFILLSGIIGLIATTKAQKVRGTIVDSVQEYTTRGFIWKAKVEYTLNNTTYFYITKLRTLRRGSDTIYLYVNKRGKIIEIGNVVWNIVFGIGAIGVAIMVFTSVM